MDQGQIEGADNRPPPDADIARAQKTIAQFMAGQGMAGGVTLEQPAGEPPATPVAADSKSRKYEVGRVFAQGGMGAILNARDLDIRRTVAMKVMLGVKGAPQERLLRFIEEAQITGQLEHPNIVPVHELGVDAQDSPFYTMKLVRGRTLKEVLDDLRQHKEAALEHYPLNTLLNVFLKVCDAVAFAHSRGVIHRDLKPENIMLGDYGEVLVMDWGLAKIVRPDNTAGTEERKEKGPGKEQAAGELSVVDSVRFHEGGDAMTTLEGHAMGTPSFMSPEQAMGKAEAVGPLSDVYTLGAILYSLLTLEPPVNGKTVEEVLLKVVRGQVATPTALNRAKSTAAVHKAVGGVDEAPGHHDPLDLQRRAAQAALDQYAAPKRQGPFPHCPGGQIPEALSAVTMKAMALRPEERYASVAELQAEIDKFQAGFATKAEQAGLVRQTWLLLKRHRREACIMGVGLAALIAVATTAFVWINSARLDAKRNEQQARRAETEAVAAKEKLDYEAYVGKIGLSQAKINENNFDAAREMLADCPPNFRNWEWGYLQRLCQLDTKTITIPTRQLTCTALSQDQQRLATAGKDKSIRVWDLQSGKQTLQMSESSDANCLLFSPDGQRLLSGSPDGTISVWDSRTGRRLRQFPAHPGRNQWGHDGVECIVFAPDGKRFFSCGDDSSLRSWDAEDYREIWKLSSEWYSSWVLCVDRFLVYRSTNYRAGNDSANNIIVVDTTSQQQVQRFQAHDRGINGAAVAPGGKRVVTVTDDALRIWETGTWKLQVNVELDGVPWCAAWSADGRFLATGMFDNTVRIVDGTTGTQVTALRGHSGPVVGVVFLSDGRLLSASTDGTVKIWNPGDYRESTKFRLNMWAGAFLSGRREIVVIGRHENKTANEKWWLQVREADTGALRLEKIFAGKAAAGSLAVSGDGRRLLTGTEESLVQLWDVKNLALVAQLPGHSSFNGAGVVSAAMSADGRWGITRSMDGCAILWDLTTCKEVRRVSGSGGYFGRVALSPDGSRVATGAEEGGATIWDRATGANLRTVGEDSGPVYAMAFSADGRLLATGAGDGAARIWDAHSGAEVRTMRGHGGSVIRAAFSPDGQRLLTAGLDQTAKLWDTRTGKELLTLVRGSYFCYNTFAFSPDGRKLLVSGGPEFGVILTAADWH